MVSDSDFFSPVANGYFLVANNIRNLTVTFQDYFTTSVRCAPYIFISSSELKISSTVTIEKLEVPEVVQSGSNVTLDCQYSVPDDNFTIMWLQNNNSVYMWRPHSLPIVTGVLEGRLDLSYKVSKTTKFEHHALRLLDADPSLSGEYTCVLSHSDVETRQTKSMLIYSTEEEFDLSVREQLQHRIIGITCTARGLNPQPDMIIEYNSELISQQSRVWNHRNLYNVEVNAQIILPQDAPCKRTSEVTCRLYLAQLDYIAIKKRFLHLGAHCSYATRWKPTVLYIVLIIKLWT